MSEDTAVQIVLDVDTKSITTLEAAHEAIDFLKAKLRDAHGVLKAAHDRVEAVEGQIGRLRRERFDWEERTQQRHNAKVEARDHAIMVLQQTIVQMSGRAGIELPNFPRAKVED